MSRAQLIRSPNRRRRLNLFRRAAGREGSNQWAPYNSPLVEKSRDPIAGMQHPPDTHSAVRGSTICIGRGGSEMRSWGGAVGGTLLVMSLGAPAGAQPLGGAYA